MKSIVDYTNKLKDFFATKQALTNEEVTRSKVGAHNLLPNTATTQTEGGVTFTVNPDGSVTINGTNNSGADITFFVSGENTVNHNPSNVIVTAKDDIKVSLGNSDDGVRGVIWGSLNSVSDIISVIFLSSISWTVQSNGETIYLNGFAIRVLAGASLSNKTFYPMVCLASDPNTEYTPYAMTNRELTDVINVNTGITGVTAKKVGRMVTLNMNISSKTATSSGWYNLGTLPNELRSSENILTFTLFDNGVNTFANSYALPAYVGDSEIFVYAYPDHLTFSPRGSVTYISRY